MLPYGFFNSKLLGKANTCNRVPYFFRYSQTSKNTELNRFLDKPNQQLGEPPKGKGFFDSNSITPQYKHLSFPKRKGNLHITKNALIQYSIFKCVIFDKQFKLNMVTRTQWKSVLNLYSRHLGCIHGSAACISEQTVDTSVSASLFAH